MSDPITLEHFDHERPEQRSVQFTEAELTGNRFEGYAAVFDQVADLGDFTEEVDRGAFRKVLAGKPNIPFVWDHNQGLPPFATTGSGTLKLTPDARGLHVIAELDDDHFMSGTLKSMIRRGDVRGMSFGFIAGPGNSRMEHRGDRPHRIITNFRAITDVCTTWQPAYAGTTAELRSAIAAYGDVPADAQVALAQAITHEPAPEWRLTDTVSQPADEGASPQLEAGADESRAEDAGTGAEENRSAGDATQLRQRRFAAMRCRLILLGERFPEEDSITTERIAP